MKIDLSMLSGKLLELAKFADENAGNSNGVYLDNDKEISLFMTEAGKAVQNGELNKADLNRIFGLEKTTSEYELIKNTYLEKLSRSEKSEVTQKTTENSNNELYEMSHNLDSMLIENEITGLGALLNRLPVYDFEKLTEKYQEIQTRYNKAENEVQNWYKDPDGERVENKEKTLFEEQALEILGMPYDEFAAQYSEELKDVAKIPPVKRGISSPGEIIIHQQMVAELSPEAKEVFTKISRLNSVLEVNFNAWENDIRYLANDETTNMTMDVIMDLDTVSLNEYADAENFEMPKNWLVKKNFIETINEIAGPVGIDKITTDLPHESKPKKIFKNGQVLIETIKPDGTKVYYDMGGRLVQ